MVSKPTYEELEKKIQKLEQAGSVNKKAEEELYVNEERLRLAMQATRQSWFDLNLKTLEVNTSPEFASFIGTETEESPTTYQGWIDSIHHSDRSAVLQLFSECLKTGKIGQMEYRMINRNSEWKWIHSSAKVVTFDENKLPVRMTGTHMDITERKKSEMALLEREERYRLVTDATTDGYFDHNLITDEVYYGDRCEETLGYAPGTIEPHVNSWAKLVHPNDMLKIQKILQDHLKNKMPYFEAEYRIKNKNNEWKWILSRAKAVEWDESGNPTRLIGAHQNINLSKQLEQQLNQSQKMESIGTLAGGIAHDFNNILFPIVGHSEMLLEDIPDNSPFRGSLNEIYAGAIRAKELVKQILTFSRQENAELKLMKMQPVIKEALKLIRHTIPTTIEIRQDIQTDCGPIKADPTQIHQIIMNLSTNAYHAMEETGGELNIKLKEVELEEPDLFNPDIKPLKYARLSISDTGKGMDKDTIKKIFDPFFTTKEAGKGTGMGLSVVHGIVKSMNGTIKVDSRSDKGTEFHIYLPLIKNLAEKKEPHNAKPI
ncbi:MAG: PAS domain-containing protein [Desulfobacteraceae bacterium]|nr:PAS domain-containing protein [Desulfobacteraceae bacterium]